MLFDIATKWHSLQRMTSSLKPETRQILIKHFSHLYKHNAYKHRKVLLKIKLFSIKIRSRIGVLSLKKEKLLFEENACAALQQAASKSVFVHSVLSSVCSALQVTSCVPSVQSRITINNLYIYIDTYVPLRKVYSHIHMLDITLTHDKIKPKNSEF